MLFQQGKRIDRPSFTMLWTDAAGPARAGFTVSRQVRQAVKRNRARRRLREAYRLAREAAPDGVALVLIGKPRALDAPFSNLAAEVRGALEALAKIRG